MALNMAGARTKSERRVAVSYLDGTEWEVWLIRFNRGSKRAKPVKFFAGREWKTAKAGCAFGGTHWDFATERAAEEFFKAQVAEYGGSVEELSPAVVTKLGAAGYEPSNSRLLPDALGAQLRRAHRAAKPGR